MHLVLCTNTHHDATDLVKIPKLEYLENGTWFLYGIKKFLICASDGTFWEVIIVSGGNL